MSVCSTAIKFVQINADEMRSAALSPIGAGFLRGKVKWNAFRQLFPNQWPLKALYSIAKRSPLHARIHPITAESTTQGDSQLVGSS